MRKIDQSLSHAIKAMLNQLPNSIANLSWSQGNTAVKGAVQDHQEVLEVRLHGHVIAVINPSKLSVDLNNAGYPTNVTHARMNAIFDALNLPHIRATKDKDTTVYTIQSLSKHVLGINTTVAYYQDKKAA